MRGRKPSAVDASPTAERDKRIGRRATAEVSDHRCAGRRHPWWQPPTVVTGASAVCDKRIRQEASAESHLGTPMHRRGSNLFTRERRWIEPTRCVEATEDAPGRNVRTRRGNRTNDSSFNAHRRAQWSAVLIEFQDGKLTDVDVPCHQKCLADRIEFHRGDFHHGRWIRDNAPGNDAAVWPDLDPEHEVIQPERNPFAIVGIGREQQSRGMALGNCRS